VENHHLHQRIGGGQELAHDHLEQCLALKIFFLAD